MRPSSSREYSIHEASSDLLDRLSTYVHKSVVFADDKFAEILHWQGGASLLLDFGATGIKEFSSFENGETTDYKGTFFLSSAIVSETMTILRDIISYSHFQHVTIITNVHPVMQSLVNFQAPTDEAASEVIATLEKCIVQLMREKMEVEKACTCQVVYVPLVAASVLPNFFFLPGHSSFFPLLPTDVQLLMTRHNLTGQSELTFEHLPKELQLKFKLLVSSLNSLSELMNLSEDIFSIGVSSKIIANEFASLSWSKTRRKMSERKVSLLLIDRTLDMGNVVNHNFESLLDKIVNVLPRLPGHTLDVGIDMSPVTNVIRNPDFVCVAPGCLAHPRDKKYSKLINTLALLKQKEITAELTRRMVEALEREGLYKKTNLQGSLDIIEYHFELLEIISPLLPPFRNHLTSIRKNSPLLQLSLGIVQTLRNKSIHSMEQIAAFEKVILQKFSDSDSVSMVLETLMEFKKEEFDFRLEKILGFLIYVFALNEYGDWNLTSREETMLEKELVEAFMDAKKHGDSRFNNLTEQCRSDMSCLLMVQNLIDKLKGLSSARSCLQKYRYLVEKGTITTPTFYQPILKQIIQDIFDASKPDLVDIIHNSTSIGDLIKTGFGFFRSSSKVRPNDNPLLIIFVVGGVGISEVKQIRGMVERNKSQCQVLIGGTSALTVNDVVDLALLQDNLNV